MKILVYCKDWYPLETGFSSAFQALCETLAAVPGIDVHVATSTKLGGAPERTFPGIAVTRLRHRFREAYDAAIVGGAVRRRGPWFKVRRLAASVSNRVVWGRALARHFQTGGYDLLLFESGDDPIVEAVQPRAVLRRSAVRFHSTGDTEMARYCRSPTDRLARALIRRRIAPNLRVLFATNRYHLDFIREFYFHDDPIALAGRYLATIDNVVADFVSGALPPPGEGPIRIVTLGRMDPAGVAQKGFEDLLYALATLTPADRARYEVVVIGDGVERARLEGVRDGLGLTNVVFTGRMANEDVRARLIAADVIALLSRFEGRSVFAIEGMLAGCAVLFTDTGGLADLIEGNGWSVPVQDVAAMGVALEEILRVPREELRRMGENARRTALARFCREQIAREAAAQIGNAVRFLDSR